MRRLRRLIAVTALSLLFPAQAATAGSAKILKVAGIINPIAAEYIAGNIEKINEEKSAELIVIEIDTPGGLDTSMRIIVKAIMGSSIPVAVYVSPSGSRAASAGTFIAMSAHISAMAPGTTQGAASPVAGGGQKMDRTMERKVKNDAAAYIRSLAKERGRNEEWAEKAVRKAVSVDEKEALKGNIIDMIAENIEDLLKQIDGMTVETSGGKKTLSTSALKIENLEMTERQRFLDIISNPTVAYMLLMLGFYGIFFELSNPGVILPGIIGAICLILGFYAMQSLPINYAGLLLLLLAVILFAAELFVPTFGVLTLGGIVSMVLGAVMLIDSPADYMQVKLAVVVPVAASMGILFFFMTSWAMFMKPRKIAIGAEGLIGETGIAETDLNPKGSAAIDGELWEAHSAHGEIKKGDHVVVIKKEGSALIVEPTDPNETDKPIDQV